MKENFSKQDTNIIKGIAIIFLMIHHCFRTPFRYKGIEVIFAPFSEAQVNHIASFLKICVGMFVFLTAYGITASIKNKYGTLNVENKKLKNYTIHRFAKLFTGWIFVFTLCELFCFVYSHLQFETYGKSFEGGIYFILDALGISNLFGTPTLVGTWWYMSLAISLIFVVPILTKVYEK